MCSAGSRVSGLAHMSSILVPLCTDKPPFGRCLVRGQLHWLALKELRFSPAGSVLQTVRHEKSPSSPGPYTNILSRTGPGLGLLSVSPRRRTRRLEHAEGKSQEQLNKKGNTVRPRQYHRDFADTISIVFCSKETICVFMQISLPFVHKGLIDNDSSSVLVGT